LAPARPTDGQQTVAGPEEPPAADPPAIEAAVELVDALAGSIRYDGKKIVGV